MKDDQLKKATLEILLKNRKEKGKYHYTVPSLDKYPFQWMWDSCFHSIMYTVLDHLTEAKEEMISLVSHQFKNGMIHHMIYWDQANESTFPVIHWGKKDTSTITQPPMLSYAVWEIYKKDKDKAFLQTIYPHLKKFHDFLLKDRDITQIYLIGIIDPDESGEDNSPRFDKALGLPPQQTQQENFGKRLLLVSENVKCNFEGKCMRNFFWVRDVPFNVITIKSFELLANIAKELDEYTDAQHFSDTANRIKEAMKKYMWEDDMYWSTWGVKPQRIKLKTWHIFSPLFAHIYTDEQAKAVVQQYLCKDGFNTQFGIPTVASDEPSYDPTGFWRGPVWIATNWFIYKGLMEYGMEKEAKKIREMSIALLEKSGFREQFNPETGEGMGAEEFTWGGLVVDMME